MEKLWVYVIGNVLMYVFFKTGRMDLFLFYCGIIPFVSYYYLQNRSFGKHQIGLILTCFLSYLPSLTGIALDVYFSTQGLEVNSLANFFLLTSGTILLGLIAGWLHFVAIRNKDLRDSLFAGIALIFVTSSAGAIGWSIRLPIAGLIYLIVACYLVKNSKISKWLVGGALYLPYLLMVTLISWIYHHPRTEAILYDIMNPLSILLGIFLQRTLANKNPILKVTYIMFLTVFYVYSYFGMKALINKLNADSLQPFEIYNEHAFKDEYLKNVFTTIPRHIAKYNLFVFHNHDTIKLNPLLQSIDSIKNVWDEEIALFLVGISKVNDKAVPGSSIQSSLLDKNNMYHLTVPVEKVDLVEKLLNIKGYPHITLTNDSLRILYNDQFVTKRHFESLNDIVLSKGIQ
ncbi:MAG: hypothetical protein Q8S18_02650 [Bacteroidales bacterium]|nr:hypothetical protein [Bacteroidales bacterium]